MFVYADMVTIGLRK